MRNIDLTAESRKILKIVIPAKAGIQSLESSLSKVLSKITSHVFPGKKGLFAETSYVSFVQKVILHKAVVSDQWLVVSKINIFSEYRKVVWAARGLFAATQQLGVFQRIANC